jgi:hypothetical protein
MKKMTSLKKTISVFTALALAIAAFCLSAFSTNAYAASENGNLKIKFKGKTVLFLIQGAFSDDHEYDKDLKNVKKAWGKPNKTVSNPKNHNFHTYKKGKTTITLGYQ